MDSSALTESKVNFQHKLLAWYDANARELPWRSEPSLYKTVVSEFMLQQTQIKTALPYFYNWLERYPDFHSLSKASEEDVLKSWEGLGYYTRARNLLKLSRQIAALDNIPRTASEWLSFPGVGPYAAAAICSIAFDDPTACVDGNVVRILSRLTGDQNAYKNSGEAAKAYRELANDIVNSQRPGDHNQAMMELGATICSKQKPQCLLCPVQEFCQGRMQGIATDLPKLEKIKIERIVVDRAWICDERGVLLRRAPETAGRMKGLYEFPSLEQLERPTPGELQPLLERKRSITHYRITERFFAINDFPEGTSLPEHCRWVAIDELQSLAFSGPHRRWLNELLAKTQSIA